jgi:hypothetical protein
MTSSARARIDGGTIRPSSFAVFRLMNRMGFLASAIWFAQAGQKGDPGFAAVGNLANVG